MNDVQDHLLAHEETVGHELASTDGDSGCVSLYMVSSNGTVKIFTMIDGPSRRRG